MVLYEKGNLYKNLEQKNRKPSKCDEKDPFDYMYFRF